MLGDRLIVDHSHIRKERVLKSLTRRDSHAWAEYEHPGEKVNSLRAADRDSFGAPSLATRGGVSVVRPPYRTCGSALRLANIVASAGSAALVVRCAAKNARAAPDTDTVSSGTSASLRLPGAPMHSTMARNISIGSPGNIARRKSSSPRMQPVAHTSTAVVSACGRHIARPTWTHRAPLFEATDTPTHRGTKESLRSPVPPRAHKAAGDEVVVGVAGASSTARATAHGIRCSAADPD